MLTFFVRCCWTRFDATSPFFLLAILLVARILLLEGGEVDSLDLSNDRFWLDPLVGEWIVVLNCVFLLDTRGHHFVI